ncbi:hypothetical protein HSE3_gp026 [Bacillus phage vB_BceM-HSE3]|nr:hypothetical protein HSE3_gp026 [Bacillus phage vB_BceM-HSE3]
MVQCSACGQIFQYFVTKSHCRSHGFENVKELDKHHPIKELKVDNKALAWAKKATVNISENTYNDVSIATQRLSGRRKAIEK